MSKDYLVPGFLESYSLWLMPKGVTSDQLQKEIDTLAAANPGAPRFPPHVTLLPDINLPGEECITKAKELAEKVKPYYINFLNITRGQIYFQCVYLLCAKDQATMNAGVVARQVYGMETPPYMPHCSLLYSDIPQQDRDQAVAQAHKRLYGEGSGYDTLLVETGFAVDSIAVWYEGPPAFPRESHSSHEEVSSLTRNRYTPTEDKSTKSWVKVAEIPLTKV